MKGARGNPAVTGSIGRTSQDCVNLDRRWAATELPCNACIHALGPVCSGEQNGLAGCDLAVQTVAAGRALALTLKISPLRPTYPDLQCVKWIGRTVPTELPLSSSLNSSWSSPPPFRACMPVTGAPCSLLSCHSTGLFAKIATSTKYPYFATFSLFFSPISAYLASGSTVGQ